MSNSDTAIERVSRLLLSRRKFLAIYTVTIALGAVLITLIIPKTFSSRSTILPPSTSVLSSFLPPQMTSGLGGAISSLTGDPGSDTYRIVSILKSRSLAEAVIEEFDLIEYFEAPTIEDAIMSYQELISVTIDEELMINVTSLAKTKFFHPAKNEDEMRDMAFEMNAFIISQLEKKFTKLQTEKARYERLVIEERLAQNRLDLARAEQELKEFGEIYGVIALPEQLEALVFATAELESQIMANQIELSLLKNTFKEGQQQVQQKQKLINELEQQLDGMFMDGRKDKRQLFPAIKNVPDIALKYAQLVREQEIQSLVLQFLMQQYEQLKIQEMKDTPTLQFIDRPVRPEKRTSPTRSITAILIFLVGMVLGVVFIILNDEYHRNLKHRLSDLLETGQ